jgi:flagellar biosynthesis protein FliQ
MQTDNIVLIAAIAGVVILAIIAAVFNISPDGLAVISRVIDILAVILGASGFARVTRYMKEEAQKPKDKEKP